MTKNFISRILTSLILLTVLFLCLFVNKFLWVYLLIVASIISFFEFNNMIKRINKNKIFSNNLASLVYLTFFVYSGYYIYETSLVILLLILFICFFSDTGGYIVGKIIGGKKLTKISPNKTISGCIGSFIFSLFPLMFIIFFFDLNNYLVLDFKNIFSLFLLVLFLSLICQLGDLFISFLKRKAKIKDTGTILPGHGGLLDRIDGILFVIPATYILIKIFL